MPAWLLWAILAPTVAGAGLAVLGGVFLGVRFMVRQLRDRPDNQYVDKGIWITEQFANKAAICECGCGRIVRRETA